MLGCGWLGLPLAEKLVNAGYRVKGSTTSQHKLATLKQAGIAPYLVHLGEAEPEADLLRHFLQARVLVLNIPPKLRSDGGERYLALMRHLYKALQQSSVSRLLFVSSTSVYPDLNRVVTEEDSSFTEESNPGNVLLRAEKLFQENENWMCTVVRFGGLVGGARQPGRFMAGKQHLPNGDAPVNLIHLDDCVAILQRILEQEQWGQVYNACADEHPSRRDFYVAAARALNLEPPAFSNMLETSFKRVNSQKLKDDLSYVFARPDPMTFF